MNEDRGEDGKTEAEELYPETEPAWLTQYIVQRLDGQSQIFMEDKGPSRSPPLNPGDGKVLHVERSEEVHGEVVVVATTPSLAVTWQIFVKEIPPPGQP